MTSAPAVPSAAPQLPPAAPAVASAPNIHSAARGVVFLDAALVLYRVFQRGFSLFLLFSWEGNGGKKENSGYLRDIETGRKLR